MSRRLPFSSRLALILGLLVAAAPSRGQNLISDPHFTSGLSSWFLLPSIVPAPTLVRDPAPGVDGAPGFAALTTGSFGPISYVARTCVPVQPGVVYSFGGAVRFRTAQNSSAVFWMPFFSDAACATGAPGPATLSSTGASGREPGGWVLCRGTGATAPPGAASAALDFILFGIGTSEHASADFDDVYVGRAGTVEPPFPIPFLSRNGILALGAALALVGALAFRPAR